MDLTMGNKMGGRTLVATLCAAVAAIAATESELARPDAEGRREAMLRKTGGFVSQPEQGPWMLVIDLQSRIPEADVAKEINHLRLVFKGPFREVSARGDGGSLAAAAAAAMDGLSKGAGVVVVLADEAGYPSVTVAPSSQYGILNVAALDTGDSALLRERFHKELLRCAAYTFGIGNTSGGMCVMKPIRNMDELDALEGRNIGPEALVQILRIAKERGMRPQRRVTYLKAVQDGWAPTPTNNYQRAIWNEIHSATNIADKAGNEDVAPPTNAPIR